MLRNASQCFATTVRWALAFTSFTACLNNIKSAAFWVNNGYFMPEATKWIISLFKSSIECTE